MVKKLILLSLLILASVPTAVFAEEQVDCSSSCPDGKVLVSFGDGNNVSCSCMIQGEMDETVANPNINEGDDAGDV